MPCKRQRLDSSREERGVCQEITVPVRQDRSLTVAAQNRVPSRDREGAVAAVISGPATTADLTGYSPTGPKERRKNNFTDQTVAHALLRAASRLFSTLLRSGSPGVDRSADAAREVILA